MYKSHKKQDTATLSFTNSVAFEDIFLVDHLN